jgi:hypothetical protein
MHGRESAPRKICIKRALHRRGVQHARPRATMLEGQGWKITFARYWEVKALPKRSMIHVLSCIR